MKSVLRWLDERLEEVACASLLTLLVLLLCLQVGLRFFADAGLAWNEELERFAFVWFAYLGTSLGVQRRGHIRVGSLINLLPPGRMRSALIVLADLVWLAFNLCVVYLGVQVMRNMARFPQDSPALGWDLMWLYAIVPLSFLLMSLRLIQLYVHEFRRLRAAGRAGARSGAFRGGW